MNAVCLALKAFFAALLGVLLVVPCVSATQLTINIAGFENNKGQARIVLFDSLDGYEGIVPPFRIESVQIGDNQSVWIAGEIQPGKYAAIVHHDENANNELDRPYLSLPLERYGYSNNVFKTLGLPDFQEVEFVVDDGPITQNISIHHNPIATMFLVIRPYRNLVVLVILLLLLFTVYVVLRRWFNVGNR